MNIIDKAPYAGVTVFATAIETVDHMAQYNTPAISIDIAQAIADMNLGKYPELEAAIKRFKEQANPDTTPEILEDAERMSQDETIRAIHGDSTPHFSFKKVIDSINDLKIATPAEEAVFVAIGLQVAKNRFEKDGWANATNPDLHESVIKSMAVYPSSEDMDKIVAIAVEQGLTIPEKFIKRYPEHSIDNLVSTRTLDGVTYLDPFCIPAGGSRKAMFKETIDKSLKQQSEQNMETTQQEETTITADYVMSSWDMITTRIGFDNYQKNLRGDKKTMLFNAANFTKGSVVKIINERYYAEDTQRPCVEVTVDYISPMDDSDQYAIYGSVNTTEGVEYGYFDMAATVAFVHYVPGKARIKCLNKVLREEAKKDKGFSPAFFTPGTVCEVHVLGGRSREPVTVTVHTLVKNGPNSYCITTGEMNEFTECEEAYNLTHVTKIIKHVPGALLLLSDDRNNNTSVWTESRFELGATRGKANRYVTNSPVSLVCHLASQYVKYDQIIDSDVLFNLIDNQGIFKHHLLSDMWCTTMFTANKKRLKHAVKQLVNKALVNPAKAQLEQDQQYYD